eukprot:2912584-Ditylum_brightwellii.AAC.1
MALNECAIEKTWCIRALFEADGLESSFDLIEPVERGAAKTIESLANEPIGIRVGVGASQWRAHNNSFILWKNAMAEGILAVSLFEDTMMGNCQG